MGKSVRGWTTQRGASRQLREKTAERLRTPGNHPSVYDGTERAVTVRRHTGTFVCPAMAPTGKSTVQERLQQPVERPPQRLEESLPFGRKPAPVLEAAKTLTRGHRTHLSTNFRYHVQLVILIFRIYQMKVV